jgi:NADH-quinone oxidoreductase subunit L
VFAYNKFVTKATVPVSDNQMSGLKKTMYNKYYVDEAYEKYLTHPLDKLASFTEKYLDRSVIDGFVNGIGHSLRSLGNNFRMVQSGNVGSYLLAMVLAMIVILFVSLL